MGVLLSSSRSLPEGLSVKGTGASVLSAANTGVAAFFLRYNTALGSLLRILKKKLQKKKKKKPKTVDK